VQDPQEALVSVMPNAAIARHSPDFVLPLRDLHTLLMHLETAHGN